MGSCVSIDDYKCYKCWFQCSYCDKRLFSLDSFNKCINCGYNTECKIQKYGWTNRYDLKEYYKNQCLWCMPQKDDRFIVQSNQTIKKLKDELKQQKEHQKEAADHNLKKVVNIQLELEKKFQIQQKTLDQQWEQVAIFNQQLKSEKQQVSILDQKLEAEKQQVSKLHTIIHNTKLESDQHKEMYSTLKSMAERQDGKISDIILKELAELKISLVYCDVCMEYHNKKDTYELKCKCSSESIPVENRKGLCISCWQNSCVDNSEGKCPFCRQVFVNINVVVDYHEENVVQ